jgi:hypothetical protein
VAASVEKAVALRLSKTAAKEKDVMVIARKGQGRANSGGVCGPGLWL